MDNLETTNDPSGEADVTASQGQSDVETQAAETEEVVDGEQSVEAEARPWDDNPKFQGKSAEDIYKAYTELEKTSGQLSQKAEVANFIEKTYGLTPQKFREIAERNMQAERQQAYQDNPMMPYIEKTEQLENKLALMEEEKKLDGFLKENQEYSSFRDKILKLGLTAERDKGYDEIAKEYFGDAIKQGQQSAYKKIETKKMTQATGVNRTEPKKGFTPEDLDKMSADELAAVLPHADTSERLY